MSNSKNSVCALCVVVILAFVSGFVRAEPSTKPATITHIVVVWLKTPGDAEARQKVIDGTKALTAIPGVMSVAVGPVMPSTRPVVVSDYDVALVFTFADAEAMEKYTSHPLHQKFVNEVVKPLVKEFKVYDFTNK